jgi:hypothetical protein
LPPVVTQHQKREQSLKGQGRNHKQINGRDRLRVVPEDLQTYRFGREFLLHGLLIRIEHNGEANCQYCCDHNSDNETAHVCTFGREAEYVPTAKVRLSKCKSQKI